MLRSRSSLWVLPVLALSCGGGSKSLSYGSPAEAAEAAAVALAAGDTAKAIPAFEAASASTDPREKADALSGLYQALLNDARTEEALAVVGRLATECRGTLTAQNWNNLATAAINRKNVAVASAVVNKALELFPEQKATFVKAVGAVDLLTSKGPGADLSALGYTGD